MDNTDPVRVGIELAAKWVDERREAYDQEHGHTDPETGALEFGGNFAKAEYSAELFEIAEGIRALVPSGKSVTTGASLMALAVIRELTGTQQGSLDDTIAAVRGKPTVMVDIVPPSTSRDRWMYEQGRLAERDPRTPEPELASIACEDCGGAGVVGDEIPQGEFQPPERERCESCNGSGRWAKVQPPPPQGNTE